MKRVASKSPNVVGIPRVVRVTIVPIEPTLIIVVVDVENVRIAIRVGLYAVRLPEHHPSISLGIEFYT